jgi:gliding motility-associated-like protein
LFKVLIDTKELKMKKDKLTRYIKSVFLVCTLFLLSINTKAQIINSFPYSESFETGFGAWQQVIEVPPGFDWIRTNSPTPTPNTGPDVAQDGDYFIYIEADLHNNPPRNAYLFADVDFTGISMPILSFNYHRYGFDAGYLRLDISTDNGATWTTDIWNTIIDNVNADQWNNVKICLSSLANISTARIRFRSQTQYSDFSDIALDNIEIVNFEIIDLTTVNPTCNSYTNGSINIEISGGFEPFYYSINDGGLFIEDYSTSYLFDALPAADYAVVVKDISGCEVDGGSIQINEPVGLTINHTKTDVSPCFNSTNGNITIIASGTYAPFEYSIDNGATYSFSNMFTGLTKGNYFIKVRNSLGCVQSAGFAAISGPPDIEIDTTNTNISNVTTCYGESIGSISIPAGGGTPQLEYSINGGAFQYSYFFPNLPGNATYVVTIRDLVGCTLISDSYFISQPSELVINSIIYEDVLGCYGDETATIDIEAEGGTGDIAYSIDNGINYFSSGNFENLGVGTYTIYVKDDNNCTTWGDDVVIIQPLKLEINSIEASNISGCIGASNGQITINAIGGTGTLEYSIDNGVTLQSSNVFTGLDVGTYYPYVKDVNNCFDTEPSVTLVEPAAVQINQVQVTNVTDCYNGNTGMITIFAAEGTSPYQYSIDGGLTFSDDDDFIGLYAGDYDIFVLDDNNCSVVGGTYTITQPSQIQILDEIYTNVSCFGGNDATIYVEATGGTGQLSYSVDNGFNYPYSSGDLSNHTAGTYIIKVKDQNNCIVTGSTIVITQPEELIIDTILIVNIQGCYGDSDGSLTIVTLGGTLPLDFSIDGGNTFQDSNYFPNLSAGIDFIPLVYDFNGCLVYEEPVLITEPDNLYVVNDSHTNIQDCYGSATGTITIIAIGGTTPIYYSIDGGTNYIDNDGLFTGLTAGIYDIQIKDSHDCVAVGFQEIITEPEVMNLDSVITQDIICHGQSNGLIYIYASGGQMPLRYSINGGIDTLYAYQFIGLYPGTYDIEVYDYYKCELDTSVTIIEPDTLMITSLEYTNVSTCYGNDEGTITVTGMGGIPELLYAYCKVPDPIIPFSTNNYFTNLIAGSYYVAVKDQNGCVQNSDMFNITSPDPISLTTWTKKDITCFDDMNGELHFTAQGGIGAYEYTIDNGITWENSGGNYLNMAAGTYICGAKDSNGCFTQSNFRTLTILEPTLLEFNNVLVYNVTCYNANDGGIAIYGTGGTLPYKFALNNGVYQFDRTFDNLFPISYVPHIQDFNGCTIIGDTIILTNPEKYSYFAASQDTGCSPLSVQFIPTHLNSTFQWIFGDGETSINTSPTHEFINTGSLTENFNVQGISYYQGCKDTTEMIITVRPLPYLNFEIDEQIRYYPDTIFYITNLSQSGYIGYNWDFGDGQTFDSPDPEFHSYSDCGDYDISLSASNEFCVDTIYSSVTLTAKAPGANFTIDNNQGCAPLVVEFANQTGDAVSYLWDLDTGSTFTFEDTTYTFQYSGDFIVRLTAYGFCNTSSTFSKEINIFDNPIANFDVEPDTVVIEQAVRFFDNCIGVDSYFWMFGDGNVSVESSPMHMYKQPGLYDVTLIASSINGCTDTLVMQSAVTVADEPFVFFPTAFSPNGDNHNDYFIPIYGQIIDAELMIFDKWGKMVFKAEDLSDYWDGKSLNGEYCPQGVYIWKVKGKYLSGSLFTDVGSLTLLK